MSSYLESFQFRVALSCIRPLTYHFYCTHSLDHSPHRHILFSWFADVSLGPFQISPHVISSAINEQKFDVLLFQFVSILLRLCILEVHASPD